MKRATTKTRWVLAMLLALSMIFTTVGLASECGREWGIVRETTTGLVRGFEEADTFVWKGIPYAKPPVGELRWKAPQDPEPWDGVFNATKGCTPCTQFDRSPGWVSLDNVIGSEDCLYLNIWRPQTHEKNLPVYFWIHGGANTQGRAEGEYDGANLARKANMVVVVIQYRLATLGWFTHPALRTGENLAEDSGNFGTLDQVKALKWVRKNIKVFGGDPRNVTIAGESAGGHNVTAMMISPLAKRLFHRAVMESGGMKSQSVATIDQSVNKTIDAALVMDGIPPKDVPTVRESLIKAGLLGDYLRNLPAEKVLRAQRDGNGGLPLGNLIEDGTVIPGNLLCTVESGHYNKVPIILGANKEETKSIYVLLPSLFPGMPNYMGLLDVLAGTKTINDVLPTDADKALYETVNFYGSRMWRASFLDEFARRLKMHQKDVYAYQFNWGGEGVNGKPYDFIYGACHALEIPFFWGVADGLKPVGDIMQYFYHFRGFNAENQPGRQALSHAMVSYLAHFARTGNPNRNRSSLPKWKAWSNVEGGPKALFLDADLHAAKIAMDTEEVAVAKVRQAIDAMSDLNAQHWIRDVYIPIMQGYAAYTPGDYVYNKCE